MTLPVSPDETGKTIALDVPIGADVANIGDVSWPLN